MVPAISLNDYEKKDCYGLKLSLNYWPVAATAQTSCVYNWHELGRLEPILLLFIRKPIQLGFFLPENQLYHLYGDGAMVLQGPRLRVMLVIVYSVSRLQVSPRSQLTSS